MSDELRARTGAVKDLAHGVAAFGRGTDQAVSTARSELNRIGAEFQAALVRSQQKLTQAERALEQAIAALRQCRENCEPLQNAVAKCTRARDAAKRVHDQNRKAEQAFQQASRNLLSTLATSQQTIGENTKAIHGSVLAYAQELSSYLASGGS